VLHLLLKEDKDEMCIRLSNKHHCLTCISVLSVVQLVWGSPIAALGLFIFFTTTLGALLSPFWAGFMVRLDSRVPRACLRRFTVQLVFHPYGSGFKASYYVSVLQIMVAGFTGVFVRPSRSAAVVSASIIRRAYPALQLPTC